MLPDLELDGHADIVPENIRAVQAIYFACQLEAMQVFQVAERLVQLFQTGQLPLGRGQGGRLLVAMAKQGNRLSAQDRSRLYARALGVATGTEPDRELNSDFHGLWLRFVASIALFERRQNAVAHIAPPALSRARVSRAARALATNASAQGARLIEATRLLAVDANRIRALLQSADIRRAFAARDMWQVIDRVARTQLGRPVDVARQRTLAVAGSTLLQWLADHVHELKNPKALVAAPAGPAVPDSTLIDAVDRWLASRGVVDDDDAAKDMAMPDGHASPARSARELRATTDGLLRSLGLQAVAAGDGRSASLPGPSAPVALFCGAAGTGKTLAAHALASSLERELLRVDLGQVVGKFIGETEKNLDAVLSRVEASGAILLLDEADALFGLRTDVTDAHDRYADLDTSQLLRRLESSPALVILASNVTPTPAALEGKAGLSPVIRFAHRPRP
jgi:hypothetical protein